MVNAKSQEIFNTAMAKLKSEGISETDVAKGAGIASSYLNRIKAGIRRIGFPHALKLQKYNPERFKAYELYPDLFREIEDTIGVEEMNKTMKAAQKQRKESENEAA